MNTGDKNFVIPHYMIILYYIDDINPKSLSDLARKSQITYSHVCDVKKLLEKKGWINLTKENRKILITTTEKGKRIKEIIIQLMDAMEIMLDKYIIGMNKKTWESDKDDVEITQ